jgi:hypothetical protein
MNKIGAVSHLKGWRVIKFFHAFCLLKSGYKYMGC